MKYFLNIFIFFIFFLCKTSTATNIFQKGENITVPASEDLIFFNSTSFKKNEIIKFEIRAKKFVDDSLYYMFLDSIDNDAQISSDMSNTEPDSTKNRNGYKIYTYNITKTNLGSLKGNYLSLVFGCEGGNVTIINIISTNSNLDIQDNVILKKGKQIKVKSEDGAIIMETKDFNKGDEIYLKITADYFYDEYIYYEFVDDISNYELNWDDIFEEKPSKSVYDYNDNKAKTTNETKYYTIKKDDHHLGNLEGNYLIIFFYCEGTVTIKNTKENEGKLSKGVIAAIIIILVLAVAGSIIFYYCKRKKISQMNNNGSMIVDDIQNYNINNNSNYNNNQNYYTNDNYDNNNQKNNKNKNNNNNQNYNKNNNNNQKNNKNNNNNQNYNNNLNNNQNYDSNYTSNQNNNNNNQNINQNYDSNYTSNQNSNNNNQNINQNYDGNYTSNQNNNNNNQNINQNYDSNYTSNQNYNNNQNNNQNYDSKYTSNQNNNNNQNYDSNYTSNQNYQNNNINMNSNSQLNNNYNSNNIQQNNNLSAADVPYTYNIK